VAFQAKPTSFGSAKHYLIERNLCTLNRLHPGHTEIIRDFQERDPIAEFRRRLDMERWDTFPRLTSLIQKGGDHAPRWLRNALRHFVAVA
jgi:hypothetical protein